MVMKSNLKCVLTTGKSNKNNPCFIKMRFFLQLFLDEFEKKKIDFIFEKKCNDQSIFYCIKI